LSGGSGPPIAVVIVAHNSAAQLANGLPALAGQLRDDDEVVVVDNASADAGVRVVSEQIPSASIVELADNRGFAGGCNAGVAASMAPLVLLLNPDGVVAPGCLNALRAAAAHSDWGAWQAVVTLHGGTHVNTSGNLVHWLGFGWAGGLDEPIESVPDADHVVGFGSGAALVVRREAWDAAGGFDERYFMYGEDLDLSLRLRLAGWETGTAVAARVDHDYEFAKGDYKWFWLERNRWWTILSDYPLAVLMWALPGLLAFEVALLPAAWHGGWLRAKLRAHARLIRELPAILARRRAVQATRAIRSARFAAALTTSLDSPNLGAAARLPGLVAVQAAWWRLLLAVLR
jgi:N-acetylglucosaminyl-diphospho-decaprenol L-rhamnosyltransferase